MKLNLYVVVKTEPYKILEQKLAIKPHNCCHAKAKSECGNKRRPKQDRLDLRLLQQGCHLEDGLKEVEVLAVDDRLEGLAVDVEDPEEDA